MDTRRFAGSDGRRWVLYVVGLELAIVLGLTQALFMVTPVAERDEPVMTNEASLRWQAPLARLVAAADRNDRVTAERAWQEAYHAAVGSRRWQALIDVAEASVRLGDVPRARSAYLTALFQARGAGSVEGVLRATEAFLVLGDRDVAAQGVRVAVRLMDERGADDSLRARLRALRERIGAPAAARLIVLA
jgi:hypothetical protein